MTLSEPPVVENSASSSSRPASQEEVDSAQNDAQRGFSQSVVVSGIRCVLTYLIFPFVFPTALGSVGPVLGLVVGSIALASNGFSIRRFWRAQHKWRKSITVIHVGVIALLIFLMVRDIQQLMG